MSNGYLIASRLTHGSSYAGGPVYRNTIFDKDSFYAVVIGSKMTSYPTQCPFSNIIKFNDLLF